MNKNSTLRNSPTPKQTQKKHPIPPTARSQRIGGSPMRLPYDRSRKAQGGIAGWIFRHRIGLLITVVIYLSLAILFVTYKIVVLPNPTPTIEIEFNAEEIIPELLEQEREVQEIEDYEYEKVQNRVSSENSEFNETLRDSKNTDAGEIYDDVERLQRELEAGREDVRKQLEEIEASAQREDSPESNIDAKQGDEDRDAFVKGNVAVSFSLEGRTANYLDMPAYKCLNGGRVVVSIVVNQNGRVTSAVVERSSSSNDRCLHQEAIASAKKSTFNASGSAPNPQRGTITYNFEAQ